MSESLFGNFEPDDYWIGEGTTLSLTDRQMKKWVCASQIKKKVRKGDRILHGVGNRYTAGNAKYRKEGVRRSSGFYEHDDQADFYHTHTGGGQNRGHRMSEDYFRAAAAVLERRGSVACDDRWASWGSSKNQ